MPRSNGWHLFVVLCNCNCILCYSISHSRTEDVVKRAMEYVNRDKRYTDTQERASSFCTGMCMYEERKAYSDCFDLCNWNGRGPSPWNQLSKSKSDFDNSIDGVGAMIRTGGKSKPSSDKLKVKQGRSWSNGY